MRDDIALLFELSSRNRNDKLQGGKQGVPSTYFSGEEKRLYANMLKKSNNESTSGCVEHPPCRKSECILYWSIQVRG